MQHELKDTAPDRVGWGVAHSLAGAYVGAVLFFFTLGVSASFTDPQRNDMFWTRQSLSDLFLYSFGGIILLSWWIVPVGALFGIYLCPKLSQWPRKTGLIRGMVLGAVLGLLTAGFYVLIDRHSAPTRTIQLSFEFLPAYCAAWCGAYSWLNGKRV